MPHLVLKQQRTPLATIGILIYHPIATASNGGNKDTGPRATSEI
jgi:hypothetical protein